MCPRISHFEPRGSWHLMRLELCVFIFCSYYEFLPVALIELIEQQKVDEKRPPPSFKPCPAIQTSIHTFKSTYLARVKLPICQPLIHGNKQRNWGRTTIEIWDLTKRGALDVFHPGRGLALIQNTRVFDSNVLDSKVID